MRQTHDMLVSLLRICKAREIMKSGNLADASVRKLNEIIEIERSRIPVFVLSHFNRIAKDGVAGAATIVDGACSVCGTKISEEEMEYLSKPENLGVCDNCLSFIGKVDAESLSDIV